MFSFFTGTKKKQLTYRRVVVIVGGLGYVGRALLDTYRHSADILFVIVSRNATGVHGNSIGIRGDITHEPEKIVSRILEVTGRIDVVVHLAATYAFETADSLSRSHMLREFDVNAIAPVLFTQEVKRQYWGTFSSEENMLEKRKVITVGSQAGEGKSSREELITYSATKAALRVFFDYYTPYLKTLGVTSVFLKPGGLQKEEALSIFIHELQNALSE